MADNRKDWLQTYDPKVCIDHNKKQIGYKEFIDKELIHFSIADNQRSIPSIVDGLKPS
jgi:DNA topoisomerase-2